MATINIFGEIGWDVQAVNVIQDIQDTKDDEINVIISSGGGSAFEGLMIYDALKSSNKKINTKILGLGASAASVIFMAGDNREMGEGSLLMVHNSWSMFMGNKEEVESQLGTLEAIDKRMTSIFVNATGLPEEEVKQLLKDESFLSAEESIQLGFATSTADTIAIAASLHKSYRKEKTKEPVKMATEEETKEAGFLAQLMAYFKKEDPKAEAKAEDEEEKEEAKAMDEGEEKEPKSMEEDDKEEAKAEGEEKPEEEAKAMEEEEEEDLKAKVSALETELAEAKASAAKLETVSQEDTEKATLIFNAVSEHKFTMFEAKELAQKSLDDVKSACKGTPVNASGAGKTERPEQASVDNKYDVWMSLKSSGKHGEAQAYYNENKNDIRKDK